MGKKIISFLSDGILSGIFLCVGCCVSMSVESKPLGAFLFSLGLCAIIVFKFGLFTGKAGYGGKTVVVCAGSCTYLYR